MVAARAASAQSDCLPGQTLTRKGECRCPGGTEVCPDGCFNLKRDPGNCGACGSVCLPGAVSRNGNCRCPGGQTLDPVAGCVDPATSTTTTTSTTTEAPTTTTTTTTRAPGIVVTGDLKEGDPQVPSNSCGGIPYRYDTFTFTHTGGALSLAVRGASSGGGTLVDPYLTLFSGAVLPGNPCVEYLAYDDESGCGHDAYLEITDLAAGTYTVMVTSYDALATGAYTFERNTFTGKDVCP